MLRVCALVGHEKCFTMSDIRLGPTRRLSNPSIYDQQINAVQLRDICAFAYMFNHDRIGLGNYVTVPPAGLTYPDDGSFITLSSPGDDGYNSAGVTIIYGNMVNLERSGSPWYVRYIQPYSLYSFARDQEQDMRRQLASAFSQVRTSVVLQPTSCAQIAKLPVTSLMCCRL